MSAETFPSLNPPAWPARLTRIGLWILAAGVVLIAASGPGHRFGVLGYRPALLAALLGTLLAALGALLAIVGLIGGAGGRAHAPRGAAALGIVIALAASSYLLWWVAQMRGAPMIHEVSTDLEDPPAFIAVKAARDRVPGTNPSEYVRQLQGRGALIDVPAQQRMHYPDLQPVSLDVSLEEAYARARRAVGELGWEIVAESQAEGRIEATDTTRFFGFKDDIVIRLRTVDGALARRRALEVARGSGRCRHERGARAPLPRADGECVMDTAREFATFRDFYPFYLSEHANRTSRRLPAIGTSLALAAVRGMRSSMPGSGGCCPFLFAAGLRARVDRDTSSSSTTGRPPSSIRCTASAAISSCCETC